MCGCLASFVTSCFGVSCICVVTFFVFVAFCVLCLRFQSCGLFFFFFFLMIRRPPRSTHCISSAASDVYKRQGMESPAVVGDSPVHENPSAVLSIRQVGRGTRNPV
eukprot:TRINITY_DN6386_c0_g2_i3.p3 TRINITY_DN6386_c0_g2~~TRINITY_DN6386_c0_g2_i3.p3  ORF type:complete len:106 (+),score=8.74 TRINITY_DN6386_c0_g2_i3:3-320(+)